MAAQSFHAVAIQLPQARNAKVVWHLDLAVAAAAVAAAEIAAAAEAAAAAAPGFPAAVMAYIASVARCAQNALPGRVTPAAVQLRLAHLHQTAAHRLSCL